MLPSAEVTALKATLAPIASSTSSDLGTSLKGPPCSSSTPSACATSSPPAGLTDQSSTGSIFTGTDPPAASTGTFDLLEGRSDPWLATEPAQLSWQGNFFTKDAQHVASDESSVNAVAEDESNVVPLHFKVVIIGEMGVFDAGLDDQLGHESASVLQVGLAEFMSLTIDQLTDRLEGFAPKACVSYLIAGHAGRSLIPASRRRKVDSLNAGQDQAAFNMFCALATRLAHLGGLHRLPPAQ